MLVAVFIVLGGGKPRRVPFAISVLSRVPCLPLRAALLHGLRLVPAAPTARVPAPRPVVPCAVCVAVSRAGSCEAPPRADSALVNAAVKAAACFQLLNGEDIFRCHPNPRLIQRLLTSFQSLGWSPAAFRIFPLGRFCRPLAAHRGLTSPPDRWHRPAPMSPAVTLRCQIDCP